MVTKRIRYPRKFCSLAAVPTTIPSEREISKLAHTLIAWHCQQQYTPTNSPCHNWISWVEWSISMAMAFETAHCSLSRLTTTTTNLFFSSSAIRALKPASSLPSRFFHCRSKRLVLTPGFRFAVKACVKVEEKDAAGKSPASGEGGEWGKVSAVLFDMDGVLCNSEEPSRRAAVDVFAEMGVQVTVDDFVPFMGTGTSVDICIFFSFYFLFSMDFELLG